MDVVNVTSITKQRLELFINSFYLHHVANVNISKLSADRQLTLILRNWLVSLWTDFNILHLPL